MKLRNQLILLSLLTLALPWAGCEYVREMENTLRQAQAQSLLNTVRTIAHITAYEYPAFFEQYRQKTNNNIDHNLYAFTLNNDPLLDGYADDWGLLADDLRYFPNQRLPDIQEASQVGLIAATHRNHLYLFLQVKDDHVIYHKTGAALINGDHLRLQIQHGDQQQRQFILQTTAPGKLLAEYIQQGTHEPVMRKQNAIHGQWQDTADGYNLELRIPLKLIKGHISFAVVDVDNSEQTDYVGWYGTLDMHNQSGDAYLIQASDQLASLLAKFGQENARLRIADAQGWLLAATERPATELTNISELKLDDTLQAILYQFYSLIMYWSETDHPAIVQQHGKLSGELLDQAMQGHGSTFWHKPPMANHAIVSASHPIWLNGQIVGTVNGEQTSDVILSMTHHALNRLILISSAVILVSALILLGYAGMLSFRIKRLRNATENIIDSDGKLNPQFRASSAGDELGELSRSFYQMHLRLSEYTQYLQTLASKLSHELRTPLAIIQSSLDNLVHTELPDKAMTYITRALQGSERLGKIITAMSEASRVEQALQTIDPVSFDLCEILRSSVNAYRDVYPSHQFVLTHSHDSCLMKGSPELIVQMLDKLVDNAVDFSPPGSDIVIQTAVVDKQVSLTVSNQGPLLPSHMQGQLFDSMVSLRNPANKAAHLGLGLHIVKLIAQAHGGRAMGKNRDDLSGVSFIITLPIAE